SVTRMRSPSKPAATGLFRPFPVRTWRIAPLEARTTVTELGVKWGIQRFDPSNAGRPGCAATVTVWRTEPDPLNFRRTPSSWSVTQMFAPSKRIPPGDVAPDPTVTVATVQGVTMVGGEAIETEPGGPKFAVQRREPSYAIAPGPAPRSVATVVTTPAGWLGLIV